MSGRHVVGVRVGPRGRVTLTCGKASVTIAPLGDACAAVGLRGLATAKEWAVLGGRLHGGAVRWRRGEYIGDAFEADGVEADGPPGGLRARVSEVGKAVMVEVFEGDDAASVTMRLRALSLAVAGGGAMSTEQMQAVGHVLWTVGIALARDHLGIPMVSTLRSAAAGAAAECGPLPDGGGP